jgi:hypothetical protein
MPYSTTYFLLDYISIQKSTINAFFSSLPQKIPSKIPRTADASNGKTVYQNHSKSPNENSRQPSHYQIQIYIVPSIHHNSQLLQ